MKDFRVWLSRHRTVLGAVAVTIVFGILVVTGRMQPSRVPVPLTFAWMLALHAVDNRKLSEKYEAAMLGGLTGLAKAGVDFRLGRKGEAAEDLVEAVEQTVAQLKAQDAPVDAKTKGLGV